MSETQGVMARQSLLEYFRPESRPPNEIAVAWRRGYRMVRWSYADLLRAAASLASRLDDRGILKGDRVLLWGENSGEWVAAFLGCLFRGAVVVPMDATAEKSFAGRVASQSGARLAVVGRGLPSPLGASDTLCLEELTVPAGDRYAARVESVPVARTDPVEIVFTSGTTAEPRGVVLRHGNLLANLEPIEREIQRYRRYERIFHPLRFLDLLPLSHVFGQLLGIFLQQILGATTVFLDTLNPAAVARTIHDERISVLVTVPRLIESLRDQLERDLAARGRIEEFRRDLQAVKGEHFLMRWWHFRAIHRRFGWRFWAVISGGAALSPAVEQFWTRLGYAVIQGYGLTETTSLISLNHPFRLGRGSIGKVLPGLEVKLAPDGEILVRGENVASGYWRAQGVAPVLDTDGWFHTGDIGERDADGNLYFKGRSKNVIVTPAGLKVYPEDLEAELRKEPGVHDCVVVGVERDGNAEPCAVLLLRDPNASPDTADAIVQRANERLAPFQHMHRWLVWPDPDFPRTPTQKPVLNRIREVAAAKLLGEQTTSTPAQPAARPIAELISRIAQGRALPASAAAPLRLSSIERVELLGELEDRYQVDLSETEFASVDSTAALERFVTAPPPPAEVYHYPRWAQSFVVQIVRNVVFHLLARPAMRILGWPSVRGRENLRSVGGPVLVVANHIEYFDPAYVLEALPGRLRNRLAVAMDGERLEAMRNPPPGTRLLIGMAHRAAYWLVVALFNVFPLPRQSGFRRSFAFAGDLVDRGWSVLIFPEGVRTRDGRMGPFRAGIGLLATQLGVPVVPAYVGGVFELKQAGKRRARPGQITVSLGPPIEFGAGSAAADVARELERRVAALEFSDKLNSP